MADNTTTVATLREAMAQFVAEREWEQFHSPKNLAMALAAEAAELMEHFLWIDNEKSRAVAQDATQRPAIADEIADVAGVVFALCNALGLDLSDAVADKMSRNVRKYPVEKCRGRYRVEEEDKEKGRQGDKEKPG
jgi:dCTP diphosphatase